MDFCMASNIVLRQKSMFHPNHYYVLHKFGALFVIIPFFTFHVFLRGYAYEIMQDSNHCLFEYFFILLGLYFRLLVWLNCVENEYFLVRNFNRNPILCTQNSMRMNISLIYKIIS